MHCSIDEHVDLCFTCFLQQQISRERRARVGSEILQRKQQKGATNQPNRPRNNEKCVGSAFLLLLFTDVYSKLKRSFKLDP